MAEKDEMGSRDNRDLYLIPRLKTMRLLNGWSMSRLAQQAEVDRDTIKKIEKNQPVSDYIAAKVFAAVSERLLPEYKDQTKEVLKADVRPSRPELKAVPRP